MYTDNNMNEIPNQTPMIYESLHIIISILYRIWRLLYTAFYMSSFACDVQQQGLDAAVPNT